MDQAINYYNTNVREFYDRTIRYSMDGHYTRFLRHLPPQGHILDAGCGVGRDTKAFINRGYTVTAFDASTEMVRLATDVTGQEVIHMTFQEMTFPSIFDGIWASASLLHVPYEELRAVLARFYDALTPQGAFYLSFKKGEAQRTATDRVFYDMTETTLEPYLKGLFLIRETWETPDAGCAAAPSGKWLHAIMQKPG